MKKLFLLIPALVLAMITNAKEINISPTYPHSSGNNLLATLADENTVDGDVIILADGIYNESSNYIVFNKSVEVRAAEGAHPIIEVETYIKVDGNKDITIRGLKFDAEKQGPTGTNEDNYSYFIRVYSAGTLELDNCEFCNTQANKVIKVEADKHISYLKINNCYFHDGNNSAIHVYQASTAHACDKIDITNTTFANYTGFSDGLVEVFTKGGALASDPEEDAEFLMDHCTFYNYIKTSDNTYGFVDVRKSSKTTISNCIFMNPSIPDGSYNAYATYTYGGTVSNCIYHGTRGNRLTPTASSDADPLFTDAANGDYTFAGNWVTMELSPARGAATDGSDLGDPRWYTDPVVPSVDFAAPYQFVGAKAALAGKIWYDSENGYIYGEGGSNKDYGTATWKFHAEKACIVGVTVNLNSGNTSGHKLRVEVLDADGNSVAEFAEQTSTLPGTLTIPAAGNYTIILHEDQTWSSAKIDNITLTYIGGDAQAIPGTTDIDDAWFSSNGTRADGKISYSSVSSGCWAKWNINVAAPATYNVTVNISGQYGHKYVVEFLKEGESTPIVVTKGATDYTNDPTLYANELGSVALEAANYEMKVLNDVGDAALHSVTLAYAGGAAVDLSKDAPASLLANADAILSDDWSIEGGKIVHQESKALTGWAKWNVNSADYGNYNVTVNIASDNGHLVRVEIFEDEAAAPIYTLDETSATQYHYGEQAIDLGNIVLDAREYVVKVSNTGAYSHVQIASIVITYQNGARATLPASCTFADLMLSEKAQIYEDMLYFEEPGDHNPVGQWAKWNVKAATAGTYLFTMNVTSDNGQSYKISILDGETVVDAFESGSVGTGDKAIKHYFNLAAGNYTVKLENSYAWSRGHVVSLVVTQPEILVLDEKAENNSVIHDNYRNGNHDIQIIRTIVPGMYNTICLPFDVNKAQLKEIFGNDVELLKMSAATLSDNELDLNFANAVEGGINRGTPYLIQTSSAVVNPVFTDVEIKAEEGSATGGEGFDADFIGNFIKGEVPAGDQNLFLGQDNTLYFSQEATPIKGMRAYFHVKVPGAAQAIKRARIVAPNNMPTAIDLVNGENKAIKHIENGQVIIIRDGKKYNVMGIRL